MTIYVDAAAVGGDGTKEAPFRSIQQAADVARPGDTVLVAPGIYRESVNPIHSGNEYARITYKSMEKNGAHITGAEPVKNWERVEGDVYICRVSNEIFADRNPFDTLVLGDWFIAGCGAHLGEVYLNERSMYEVMELSQVVKPERSALSWEPDFSLYTWYTEQNPDANETMIYANFQGKNPNEENVEISVRKECFCPKKEGVGFITLSGFRISQAATQWAPPTAYQEGMVGPHWSKGWIIEDCEIYESKCSGISLGKYLQENNENKWLKTRYKDGTQTQRECVCQASYEGWDREHVGSHTIRRCCIHDCGQTGIVGHLGGVFSVIEDNHIYRINHKQNLAGAEIGGIKMHAAIDTIYRHNHIHHCSRGIWLDWQAQGTRVTCNFLHDNCLPYAFDPKNPGTMGEDIFVEVSHGPTLIDRNILLSDRALKLPAQGVALVHNLVAGSITTVGKGTDNGTVTIPSARFTPYHVKHDTRIAGFMTILHGDMKFYNNIFLQQPVREEMKRIEEIIKDSADQWDDGNTRVGTAVYDDYPTQAQWEDLFPEYCGMGSPASDRYYEHLPIWAKGNVYLSGACAWKKEVGAFLAPDAKVSLDIWQDEAGWHLKTNVYDYVPRCVCEQISTDTIPCAFEPEQCYENPDGTPIFFDTDYFGTECGSIMAGPFAAGKGEWLM